MTIRWHCLPFESLPNLILYDLLRLRSEVFVVEQNCVFQDIDRQDMDAHHLLGYNEAGELAAYARLFDAGKSYEQASIGRVIVAQPFRQYGLGRELTPHRLGLSLREPLDDRVGCRDIEAVEPREHPAAFPLPARYVSELDVHLVDPPVFHLRCNCSDAAFKQARVFAHLFKINRQHNRLRA